MSGLFASVDHLEDNENGPIGMLSTAVERAAVSTETRLDNLDEAVAEAGAEFSQFATSSSTLASAISSVASQTVQDVATISRELTSTTNDLNDVSSQTASVSTMTAAVSQATKGATDHANSAVTVANTAVSTAGQAVTMATTANGNANDAKTQAAIAVATASAAQAFADAANTKISNLISDLGCLATGCTNGECDATTRKCVTSVIGQGMVGITVGNVILANTSPYQWKSMCYKRSVHGGSSYTWHSLCNNKAPLLVIARGTDGRYFGAVSTIYFTGSRGYHYSNDNFLWRYYSSSFQRTSTSLRYPQHAIYDTSSYGPTFGGGHDWKVDSNMYSGYSNAHSYTGSGYSDSWLAGSYSSWRVSDMEVYYQT
jgi:hypothetical protein